MMKDFSKRESARKKAPEETYASETEWVREPAPAGALQRAYGGGFPDDAEEVEDAPYKPRLGTFRQRVKMGVPKSKAGRIMMGAFACLMFGAVAAAAWTVRNYLLHNERFVVPASAMIETQGNAHVTRAQMLSVFGSDLERNIFKVPLAERRAELERLPWVQHATVMRLLPNRIRVSIVERTPVAFVRQGTHIGLVDGSGVLLDMPEDAAGDTRYSFPVLTGLAADDPLSTRAARMEIYKRLMKELDGSGAKISEQLSEVDVSSPDDVKALIPSGGTDVLVHFGDEDFLKRYRHFEENLPVWKKQYPKLASADMRYERQVVLEMQPGTAVPVSDGDAPGVAATAPETKPVEPPATRAAVKPIAPKVSAKAAGKSSNAKMQAALAAARAPQAPGAGQVQR